MIVEQVRQYIFTSVWGGLFALVPPRKLFGLAKHVSAAFPPDTLWYFEGKEQLPVSLTFDDAPGNLLVFKYDIRMFVSWKRDTSAASRRSCNDA